MLLLGKASPQTSAEVLPTICSAQPVSRNAGEERTKCLKCCTAEKYLIESKIEKKKEQRKQRKFRQESGPEQARRWKSSKDMAGGLPRQGRLQAAGGPCVVA